MQFKQEQVSLEELLKKSCVTLLIPMELRGQALLIHADGAFRGDLSWTSEAIGNIVKNCMEHTLSLIHISLANVPSWMSERIFFIAFFVSAVTILGPVT